MHYLKEFCEDITVMRNDEITAEETDAFSHIVLSPGPGLPNESGNLMKIIERQIDKKPILGICLGMQAIAEHFGGQLFNQPQVKHGITTEINTSGEAMLFKNTPRKFMVGLYHSWAVETESLPESLWVTAKSADGIIMALEHQSLSVCGVQFHPESILTEYGKVLLENWVNQFKT